MNEHDDNESQDRKITGATPTEGHEPPASAGKAGAEDGPPTGADGAQGDAAGAGGAGAEAVKKSGRRRGRRGGQRHKSAAVRAAEAAALAGGEAAAPAASAATAASTTPATATAADAAPAALAGAHESNPAGAETDAPVSAPKRRRSRRSGARKPAVESGGQDVATAAAAPAAEQAPPFAPAEKSPPVTAQESPATPAQGSAAATDDVDAAPTPRRRTRPRRSARTTAVESAATETVPAAAAPVDAAVAPREASPAAVAAESATSTAADETSDEAAEAPKKRRRRRGGRGRGKSGKDAAATLTTMLVADAAGEDAAPLVDVEAAVKTDVVVDVGVAPTGDVADEETKPARSRRGRRRKTGAEAGTTETKPSADKTKPESTRSKIKTRERSSGDRGKVAVATGPPKRKQILVSAERSELRVALVEDGRLAEIYIERPNKLSYLGNIYRGKVDNVLSGMDAAFVDFGLEKNGFLYVDEVELEDVGSGKGKRITQMLKSGQEIIVQVMKDPMGSKGARLTTRISLAGRYVVYVPGGNGVGISRRLRQEERDRLRDLCKTLKLKDAGLIVRTAAEGKGLEEMKRDIQFLSRLWTRLKKKADVTPAAGLVHAEVDIALEVTRDLFNDSCESLIVDSEKKRKEIVSFLDKVAPELSAKVHLHSGEVPLFEAYGIEAQISSALERKVLLPSGGNIVIDHAEALTVIDVNSGRFTGGKGLEDTITHTNLEAAGEVVRQLRLRDIGGIIIIDFIDMSYARNREAVLAKLEAELDTDRTKTYVVELSPLGLVEMTRQNTTDGARGILTKSCPMCQGKARINSEETVALGTERRLRALAKTSAAKAFLIEVNRAVAERLQADGRLKQLEKEIGRKVFLEGSISLPIDSFRVLSEGPVAQVEGQRLPVHEGQEIEIELEHSLTHSPQDAVGFVDGYMIIVDGGRPFIGMRRKVKIESTWRTGAYGTAGSGKAR